MEIINRYFPNLTEKQIEQFRALYELYKDWNSKINLISRKDIDSLYERHVLHSLGIAEVIKFSDDSHILDVGTGGGFPGIPLAIFFPKVHFVLLDSIGKKIKVANEIANAIGLKNTECIHSRVEEEKRVFDFIVSRAVMPLGDLVKTSRKNISSAQKNALPNGIICLKGGDLQAEVKPFKNKVVEYNLANYFKEPFFSTKKVIYLPLHSKK